MTLAKIEKSLQTQQPGLETQKQFKDNVGTIEVYFEGTMDELVSFLLAECVGVPLEIVFFEDFKIEAKKIEK